MIKVDLFSYVYFGILLWHKMSKILKEYLERYSGNKYACSIETVFNLFDEPGDEKMFIVIYELMEKSEMKYIFTTTKTVNIKTLSMQHEMHVAYRNNTKKKINYDHVIYDKIIDRNELNKLNMFKCKGMMVFRIIGLDKRDIDDDFLLFSNDDVIELAIGSFVNKYVHVSLVDNVNISKINKKSIDKIVGDIL